jgi:hypothetical protein
VPEPRVLDVRRGLTEEVLDHLRRARRVVLVPKGNRTAALGYWLDEQLHVAIFNSEGLPWIRVPPQSTPPLQLVGAPFRTVGRGHRFASGVLMDIPDAQQDDFWTRFTSLLRPGDVLRLGVDPLTARHPVLRVSTARTTFAVVNIPRPPRRAHTSAA